ncbi:hypothetical protein ACFZDG_15850 [Kitasatospora xanthocidica]|uniref:hypothetical protein n=1 Tax=Kitasatospora xanthocidica TaxID=83382 RepID=UPI0036F0B2BD
MRPAPGHPRRPGPTVRSWAKVERYLDTTPGFHAEQFPSDGRGDRDGARRTYFGTGEPSSARFLLYSAAGWDTGSRARLLNGLNHLELVWAPEAESQVDAWLD